jgi:hypothetical protein
MDWPEPILPITNDPTYGGIFSRNDDGHMFRLVANCTS